MLTGAIGHFERYISFLEGKIAEDHEFKLGDWLGGGSSKLTPKSFVRDIYLLKALRITALAYKLSGKPCARIENRYSEAKARFEDSWLDADGRCTVDEQTPISMMIMFGLYRDRSVLMRQLAAAVERDGCKLTSGMVGIQYLYDALGESGRGDLACRIITESDPGYRTWYEHGATTLWEMWGGIYKKSHNHHMNSNVIAWFYKGLLGIAPSEEAPGFERIELKPCFVASLGYVKGRMDTVRGRIEAEWTCRDGGFEYTVTLPKGVSASFDGQPLKVGKNIFFIKET